MASLQFEGALKGLSEKQEQFLRDVLEKRGYTNNKVIFAPAGKAGDNFLADVLRITVIDENGDDFQMVAKCAPHDEYIRGLQDTKLMFYNETTMYEELLPKYLKLQIEAGVPEMERIRFAQCYGSLTEELIEVLLLEDLKPLDYSMLDKLAPMNEDAVLLVVRNFANLHAMSFVLMHTEPETYEKCISSMVKMWDVIAQRPTTIAVLEQIKLSALEILKEERYKEVVRGTCHLNVLFKDYSKEDNPKYLVIQQGDSWTNNIMFKLKDGKALDAIMIDYQLASQTSPAADLIYFIFNCTNYEARAKNYHKWIDTYHELLDKYLSYFNLKASDVYPKEQLDADLKRYAKLFFGVVVMLYGVLARNPEETAAVHERSTTRTGDTETDVLTSMRVDNLSEETVSRFKCRMEELIDSYRDFGYIS